MTGLHVDNAQIGQSSTASQNFNIRTLLDGTFRISRGNAGAEISDLIKINADNSIELLGNLLSGVLGAGQTWQLLTGTRALGTTYTNTTGKPIYVVVCGAAGSAAINTLQGTVSGVSFFGNGTYGAVGIGAMIALIVPAGATYSVQPGVGNSYSLATWAELR